MRYNGDFNPVDDLFDKQNSNQNNSLNTSVPNIQNTDSVIQENNESWQNNNVTNTNYNQSIIKDNMINNENINNDINDIQYNQNNNKKRGFNKSIIYFIVGFLLFIIVGIVITNLVIEIIKQKKSNEEEISVLMDSLSVKAVGFEFDQPFDKNKFEYNLEIDTQKVQFKCNKIDSVTGCNETVNLVNKTNLDHIIEYTSQKGKKYSYTFHIIKKDTNGPIKIDSIEFEKTDYSNKSTTVVVKANSDKNKKLKYSFDGGNTWQDDNKYTTDENEDVNVVIKDDDGNTTDPKEIEIDNIDTVAPTVNIEEKEKQESKVILFANAKDDSSGIDKYNWNESGYTNNSTYEATKAGTYTVKVKDKAGNESVKASITIPESYFKKDVKKETYTYKVTFNGNGASVSSSSLSCNIYNTVKTCNVTVPTITRSGWTILGFSTSASATTGSTAKTLSAGKTYYAITKKNITVTFAKNDQSSYQYKDFDYIEYPSKSKSCTVYNTGSCKIKIPFVDVKGLSTSGFVSKKSNPDTYVSYIIGQSYDFNQNTTLYVSFYNSDGFKNSIFNNVGTRLEYKNNQGKIIIDFEKGCNATNYKKFFDTLSSKAPYLFSGNMKITIYKPNTFNKGFSKYKEHDGLNYGYSSHRLLAIKYYETGAYSLIIHELAHRWNSIYSLKNNKSIEESFSNLYTKYKSKPESERPMRKYSYNNLSEFFADTVMTYYFLYIDKNTGVNTTGWYLPNDIKSKLEQYIS